MLKRRVSLPCSSLPGLSRGPGSSCWLMLMCTSSMDTSAHCVASANSLCCSFASRRLAEPAAAVQTVPHDGYGHQIPVARPLCMSGVCYPSLSC